jgi:hypothetical protein
MSGIVKFVEAKAGRYLIQSESADRSFGVVWRYDLNILRWDVVKINANGLPFEKRCTLESELTEKGRQLIMYHFKLNREQGLFPLQQIRTKPPMVLMHRRREQERKFLMKHHDAYCVESGQKISAVFVA